MSQSNAAAIRRRTNPVQSRPTPPSETANTPPLPQPKPQTLQQVIGTFDNRIKKLEENLNGFNSYTTGGSTVSNLPEVMNEFNSRFELIAEEIANMKDVVIKLQSYTMDVNKALLDEHIHVHSDLGQSANNSVIDVRDGTHSPTSVDLKHLAKDELSVHSEISKDNV